MGSLYSQVVKNNENVWIRESYVNSIDIKNDTLEQSQYLWPIIGFSKVFEKKLGVMRYGGDEIPCTVKIVGTGSGKQVNINLISGYLNDYLISKGIHKTKSVVGTLKMKDEKLLFQIWNGKKLIEEFYYVDHYKDYYFMDLRKSYKYLYNLKHPK